MLNTTPLMAIILIPKQIEPTVSASSTETVFQVSMISMFSEPSTNFPEISDDFYHFNLANTISIYSLLRELSESVNGSPTIYGCM